MSNWGLLVTSEMGLKDQHFNTSAAKEYSRSTLGNGKKNWISVRTSLLWLMACITENAVFYMFLNRGAMCVCNNISQKHEKSQNWFSSILNLLLWRTLFQSPGPDSSWSSELMLAFSSVSIGGSSPSVFSSLWYSMAVRRTGHWENSGPNITSSKHA